MGFTGVFQSLKSHLGSVCGLCVCNGGVTPDSKELPIGHEILKKTYVVGGWGAVQSRGQERRQPS